MRLYDADDSSPAGPPEMTPKNLVKLPDVKVLIIDDDSMMRDLVRRMLRRLGIEGASDATDGAEGIRRIEVDGAEFGLVICDWNMPDTTGLEVLKSVRTTRRDLPFLMLTGRGDAASVVAARQSGVSAYMVKPFSMAEFETKIRALVGAA
jgi:two-component system, chemotaxis family, chemotaxis protein CheY